MNRSLPFLCAPLAGGPVSNETLKQTHHELGWLKRLQIVDDAIQTMASYSEEWTFDARCRPSGGERWTPSAAPSRVRRLAPWRLCSGLARQQRCERPPLMGSGRRRDVLSDNVRVAGRYS